MDHDRIKNLLQLAAESEAAEVEFEENGTKLIVRRNASPVVIQPQVMLPSYMPPATPIPTQLPLPTPAPSPVVQEPAAPEPTAPEKEEETGTIIRAATLGTYYAAATPESDPFVALGDRVQVGDTLCIIEAMKLMNEIESEIAGTIRKIYVSNGEPVEFDQPLFLVAPE